jgi:hypothetical protein
MQPAHLATRRSRAATRLLLAAVPHSRATGAQQKATSIRRLQARLVRLSGLRLPLHDMHARKPRRRAKVAESATLMATEDASSVPIVQRRKASLATSPKCSELTTPSALTVWVVRRTDVVRATCHHERPCCGSNRRLVSGTGVYVKRSGRCTRHKSSRRRLAPGADSRSVHQRRYRLSHE